MAVAALSMSHRDGITNLEALQHYHEVTSALQSSLRSAQDLSSDGTFLTHFLLLLYDIAAAEPSTHNLWSQHLAQLLRIVLLRREAFGGEKYPFIIWSICNIDMYALFSGAGEGGFVGTMLESEFIPPPSFHLCPLGADGSSVVYGEETETMPTVLQFNYDVTILAVRLGLLAKELREEFSEQHFTADMLAQGGHFDTRLSQSRVQELQDAFRSLWANPSVRVLEKRSHPLSGRPRQILEHALSLHRASMIYSMTSMWPTQRLDEVPSFNSELEQYIGEILQMAEGIVSTGRLELRFIIFPLFMAGVASNSGNEKRHALDLIKSMEHENIGTNTSAIRRVLQTVYEKQAQSFMHTGHSLDVNWMNIMIEHGLQVVNFGL
ncbi:MAG: hypothetical protein Q9227_006045 [Pyrenula ochraceoflavens]